MSDSTKQILVLLYVIQATSMSSYKQAGGELSYVYQSQICRLAANIECFAKMNAVAMFCLYFRQKGKKMVISRVGQYKYREGCEFFFLLTPKLIPYGFIFPFFSKKKRMWYKIFIQHYTQGGRQGCSRCSIGYTIFSGFVLYAIQTSGHMVFQPSSHPDFWLSGLLDIRSSGHPAI